MSGMTLWIVDIRKTWDGGGWSNVYHVNAGNLAAAITAGSSIVAAEKAVHSDGVAFVEMEVRPALLGAGGGTVVALSGNGAVAFPSAVLAPFVTARCVFRPNTGKPSQKYLRLCLDESSVNGRIIEAARLTAITNNYLTPLMAIAAFVDPQGQAFVSATVRQGVQQRQTKRQRTSRPGFKRGWVPV